VTTSQQLALLTTDAYDRTKHVEIDQFFIKEKLNNGLLELNHVTTGEQVAYCLIKKLTSSNIARFCDKMVLVDIFFI
jgi:hypothetical protein